MIPSPIFIIDYAKSDIKFANDPGLEILNYKQNNYEKKDFFYSFEIFLKKFTILPNRPESMQSFKQGEDLSIHLKKYYKSLRKDLLEKNIKTHAIEKNFITINVSTCEQIKGTDSFYNANIDNFVNETHKTYYEIKVIQVYWEENVCLLVLFNNNTNIFRISELLNLDSYKNQLLASISHDLRTPLNGLNGMLELSIEKTSDQSTKEFLVLAKKSASFLNYLINDILDFSLMSFKKLRLNIEEIDVYEIMEQMRSLIEFQAKEKNLNFLMSFPEKLENENLNKIDENSTLINSDEKMCKIHKKRIFNDPTRIKQILLNLLSNALKFTQEGSIQLLIEDITTDISSPLYRFSVKDTGIGIKQEDLKKLCHLFNRLENPDNVNKTGIGLGLTISKKISKLLSNHISEGLQIESIYGKGSIFSFYISSLEKDDHKCHICKKTYIDLEGNNIKAKNNEYKSYIDSAIAISANNLYDNKKTDENLKKTENCENSEFYKIDDFDESKGNIKIKKFFKGIDNNQFLKRILVVDDDLFNLLVAEQYLTLFKIPSYRALNGLEAYKLMKNDVKMQKCEISMIIMDCNMPVLDGFQASAKINRYLKKHHIDKVPILAVTANITEANMILCKNSGMEYFLEKPMKKDDLKEMIENILHMRISI